LAHTGGRVTGVRTTDGDLAADWVVLAAGAWSSALLADLGVQSPVRPLGLQMILTTPRPAHLAQVVTASAPGSLSFKQLREGNYLIGGGWPGDYDLVQPRGTIRPESVSGSLSTARAIVPDVAETEVTDSWVGIEAFAPDEIPILGLVPGVEHLTVAFGFSGHGFALSPMTGQVIAELILDGRPSIPIDDFALSRFAGQSGDLPVPAPHAG
jgi:sarcosine oxidase subunit beta